MIRRLLYPYTSRTRSAIFDVERLEDVRLDAAHLRGDCRWSGVVAAIAAVVLAALGAIGVPGTAMATQAGDRGLENAIADVGSRSTYPPCSTITWAYDASAQPRSGAAMLVDVCAAPGLLSQRTGVGFQEMPFGAAVDLVFDWSSLGDYDPGTQAAAWRSKVTFATGAEMARDEWSGLTRKAVQRSDGSFDVGIGRGWLVVHEVLHSLGLAHSDEAGSVMSPFARIANVLGRGRARREKRALPRPGFSPGDLATLAAMYPRVGCPFRP
ncbi:MAG: matrixin family metalloprotease [Candidatus Nanopelagicales bacterium]